MRPFSSRPCFYPSPGMFLSRSIFTVACIGGLWGLQLPAMAVQQVGTRSPLSLTESLTESPPTSALDTAQKWLQTGTQKFSQGDRDAALAAWKQAESAYRQANDPAGILGSQLNQAQALQAMGLYRQATLLLTQINDQLQHQPDSLLKMQGLTSLGNSLRIKGDLQQSQQVLEQSLAIAQSLDSPAPTSLTRISLGHTLHHRGQLEAALEQYRQAQTLAQQNLQFIEAQINQLRLLTELKRYDQAQIIATSLPAHITDLAHPHQRTLSQIQWAIHTLQLKTAYPQLGIPQTAIAQTLAQAMQQAQRQQDFRLASLAAGQLGAMYEGNQQWADALHLTQMALDFTQRSDAEDMSYRWHWQLGRLYQQLSQQPQQVATQSLAVVDYHQKAIASYRQAVEILNRVRTTLLASDQDVQLSYQANVEPVYRELASLLLHDQSTQTDLEQARELIEDLQLAELENYFRSACIDSQSVQLDQIDPHAAIIYPIILRDRLEVITSVPGQGLIRHTVDISAEALDQTLVEYLSSLNPRFPSSMRLQLAQKLHRWLIEPTAQELQSTEIKTLVFVLDGMLRNIPMASLHNGERYVIEDFGVAIAPGLQQLKSQASGTQPRNTLIAGLSEARHGFTALPGVQQEVEDIQSNLKSQLILNDKFTEKKLKSALNSQIPPILHLATHGQFSSNPDETFLLSWDRKIDVMEFQSLLTLADREENVIELLVLSACQTASGDRRAALGLAGLAIQSGARSTLGTLWGVQDDSTAALMAKFYRDLGENQQASKSELLRQAQLDLLNHANYSHPFYWAPFVLVGNWQ